MRLHVAPGVCWDFNLTPGRRRYWSYCEAPVQILWHFWSVSSLTCWSDEYSLSSVYSQKWDSEKRARSNVKIRTSAAFWGLQVGFSLVELTVADVCSCGFWGFWLATAKHQKQAPSRTIRLFSDQIICKYLNIHSVKADRLQLLPRRQLFLLFCPPRISQWGEKRVITVMKLFLINWTLDIFSLCSQL